MNVLQWQSRSAEKWLVLVRKQEARKTRGDLLFEKKGDPPLRRCILGRPLGSGEYTLREGGVLPLLG